MLNQELQEYQYILFKTQEGQIGRDYLLKRNIQPATALAWQLGYCPINYVPHIYKKNKPKFNQSMLQGRLIIPIYNVRGKLISLGGRNISSSSKTKYTNYPFPTARNLFGLYLNRKHIYEENIAIITEGQLDVISAWQKGIKTVVCSFGAHSGAIQVALLSRYTDNIHVIYDSDTAGLQGLSTLQRITTQNINLQMHPNLFPPGQDLDNWIQNHTKEDLYNLINTINNPITELQNQLLNQLNMNI